MKEKETIVISLGGAIVVPDVPNPSFISLFRDIILNWVKRDKRFVIIVGGGKTCRHYNEALGHIIDATNEDLDWMGIYTTQLNAQLIRLSFNGAAHGEIITDPSSVKTITADIVIGAGWKPGCSTDTDAVLVAKEIGAKKIINLSNIDYVYDSDPRINPDAKKFENISWQDYRSIITSEWEPGSNTPFDPVASEKAQDEGIEVAFMSGQNLENLENFLNDKPFVGTIIK